MQKIALKCGYGEKFSFGFAIRRDLTQIERLKRGLKVLGAALGLALIAVFIPVLHFVLVPLFLLIGIIWATKIWRQKAMILNGEITCPSCATIMPLDEDAEVWPKGLRCRYCYISLEIWPTP